MILNAVSWSSMIFPTTLSSLCRRSDVFSSLQEQALEGVFVESQEYSPRTARRSPVSPQCQTLNFPLDFTATNLLCMQMSQSPTGSTFESVLSTYSVIISWTHLTQVNLSVSLSWHRYEVCPKCRHVFKVVVLFVLFFS